VKIRIEVTIGEQTLVNEYQEDDTVFALRYFPLAFLDEEQDHLWYSLAPKIDHALEVLQGSERVPL